MTKLKNVAEIAEKTRHLALLERVNSKQVLTKAETTDLRHLERKYCSEPVNKRKKTVRNNKGQFGPGNLANPDGRPVGSANRYAIADLFHALLGVEEQKKKKLLTLYCERAFSDESPQVLLHLIERFLPALKALELSGTIETGPSQEDCERIREILRGNFETAALLREAQNGQK